MKLQCSKADTAAKMKLLTGNVVKGSGISFSATPMRFAMVSPEKGGPRLAKELRRSLDFGKTAWLQGSGIFSNIPELRVRSKRDLGSLEVRRVSE